MTAVAPRAARSPLLAGSLAVGAAVATGVAVSDPTVVRPGLAAVAAFALVVAALRLPVGAVLAMLVTWLAVLGLVRRLTSGISPKQAWGDPLLLVGAAVWVVLALLALQRGGVSRPTPVTKSVVALGGFLAASTLNPAQGGLTVGLSGALLVVVPMLAFLVGRALVDDRVLQRLLWLVAALGVPAAVYGLIQTLAGFPEWDQAWINNEGYTALNVGGAIRAFSSFSAGSEYATFLGIAMVAWIALGRGVLRWPLLAAALPVLAAALWYESSRTFVVLTVAAVGAMLAARAGLSFPRALVAGVAVLAVLPATVSWLAPDRFANNTGDRLAQHQLEGLTDPFSGTSTLPGHIELVRRGVKHAVHNPAGTGIGSITISARKYGGASGPAEADPGRIPFAAGLPGLAAYFAVVVLTIPRAYRLAARRRDRVSLAALGVLVVTFLHWHNGGHYAVVFWPWLAIGWLDGAGASLARRTSPALNRGTVGVGGLAPSQRDGRQEEWRPPTRHGPLATTTKGSLGSWSSEEKDTDVTGEFELRRACPTW